MTLTYDDVIMNPFQSLVSTNKLNSESAKQLLAEVIGDEWKQEDYYMDRKVGPGDLYWNRRPNDLPSPHKD